MNLVEPLSLIGPRTDWIALKAYHKRASTAVTGHDQTVKANSKHMFSNTYAFLTGISARVRIKAFKQHIIRNNINSIDQ